MQSYGVSYGVDSGRRVDKGNRAGAEGDHRVQRVCKRSYQIVSAASADDRSRQI